MQGSNVVRQYRVYRCAAVNAESAKNADIWTVAKKDVKKNANIVLTV